jgi:hypothetical protein
MQMRQHRESPTFLPIETKPLPAWLEPAQRVEPERPSRFVWIILGVALLFGFVMGGGYWLSQRGQPPVGTVEGSPAAARVKPAPVAEVPPAIPPAPQLAVGLPALSRPTTTESVAARSPVPVPSQPPQLAVGLRPIAGQTPPDALVPEPAAEAKPLPSPGAPPKPHRNATPHPSLPTANPSRSSDVVKF